MAVILVARADKAVFLQRSLEPPLYMIQLACLHSQFEQILSQIDAALPLALCLCVVGQRDQSRFTATVAGAPFRSVHLFSAILTVQGHFY